ncbi:MAG: NADH-quinone oxidoreductase subunit C [Vampirovibrio sp.]|nr:NADH-quinone oxidoreductase subunit C [Vampirovibrio sp.]
MSEPTNENAPENKEPAPNPPQETPEEKGPEPGEFGKLLAENGLTVDPLGPDAVGVEMIGVAPDKVLDVAKFLRDSQITKMDFLMSVSGVDHKEYRESVYHVYSVDTHKSICIKVKADNDHVPSLMPVWPAADWHEREAFDLFGIIYDGHPDLRRLLMPVDWIGYPLRKDYKQDDPRLVWNER